MNKIYYYITAVDVKGDAFHCLYSDLILLTEGLNNLYKNGGRLIKSQAVERINEKAFAFKDVKTGKIIHYGGDII